MIKTCNYCKQKYKSYKSRNNSKFCSKRCMNLSCRNRITLKCIGCNKIFEVTPSMKDRFNYCSIECKKVEREKLKQKRIACECGCGHELNYLDKTGRPRRFIKGHVNIWNKSLTKETDERVKKLSETHKRGFDLGLIERPLGNKNPMYGKSGELSPTWNNGSSFEPYGIAFNKSLKNQIRKRDNYTCQECGKTEEGLKRLLSIHHIDYNKNNNNQFNLISLCLKCHSITNYRRKHWESYFKMKVFIREFFNPQNIKVFNENKQLIVMDNVNNKLTNYRKI